MNNNDLNIQKVLTAFENTTQVHLKLFDKTFRNGYVQDVRADFFIFEDNKNGLEPIWFLEVMDVEPYIEGGEA